MAYFQNPFDREFRGIWSVERNFSLNFSVPANRNHSDVMVAWNYGPYDLSTDSSFTINYAFDKDFKNYASLSITISGATPTATTAQEIVDDLNDNAIFADYFVASVDSQQHEGAWRHRVFIKTINSKSSFRSYISNSGAEKKLKFNKYAGIADIPLFLGRHSIANRFNYADSQAMLVPLTHAISSNSALNPTVVTSTAHGLSNGDVIYIVNSNCSPTIDGQRTVTVTGADTFTVPVNVSTAGTRGTWLSAVEYQVVTDFGLDYTTMKEDYELLAGRGANEYVFRKQTVSNDQVTQIIEYPAGAAAGDLAKKIQMTYSDSNDVNPITRTEIPYVLTASDLITPP